MKIIHQILTLLLLLLPNAVWANSENILLGVKATYSIKPNYAMSEGHDEHDLTDGKYRNSKLFNTLRSPWTSKDTVTWMMKRKRAVIVSFDLGSIKHIEKINFGTHSGDDVAFPLAVLVYISNNKKTWSYAGNLVNEFVAQTKGITSHMYSLSNLMTRGRFISFYVVTGSYYLNLDEIEVYGNNAKANITLPSSIISIERYSEARLQLIKQKLTSLALIEAARDAIKNNGKTHDTQTRELDVLESKVKSQIRVLPESDEELGPPYTSIDRQVSRLAANFFKTKTGRLVEITPIIENMWSNDNNPFARHSTPKTNQLHMHMANNEIEPFVLSISNNSDTSQTISVNTELKSIQDKIQLPNNRIEYYLSTHVVASDFGFYDDALTPISSAFTIEAGITRQLWVFINSSGVKHGSYSGSLTLNNQNLDSSNFDLQVDIHPINLDYHDTHKSLTWAYLSKGRVDDKHKNKHAHLLKRSHNSVQVLLHEQIPWPKVDRITKKFVEPMELDFTEMDKMIRLRPEVKLWLLWPTMKYKSRRLLNFYSATNTPTLNSKQHSSFIKQWIRLIKSHMNNLGLTEDNYAFYWVDEPRETNGFLDIIVPYSKLAKEIDDNIQTFITHRLDPELISKYPDAIDIHCIPTGDIQLKRHNNKYLDHKLFKNVWHYRTDGLKQRDPYTNYRLHHSYTFVNGLNGAGFWVWNDKGGQWRDQLSAFPSMGIIYRSKKGPITSKRHEAWREGIEDAALWNEYQSNYSEGNNTKKLNLASELRAKVYNVVGKNRLHGEHHDLINLRLRVLESLSAD